MSVQKEKCFLYITLSLFFMAALTFYVPSAFAQAVSFLDDYQAIEQVAKSVLMLEVYDRQNELLCTGSGFVAFDNRTLITNYHVMEGAEIIKAYTDDGDYYRLDSVISADKDRDIAILRFESPSVIQPLTLHENAELLRGQPVVAIGSPVGIKNTVSTGIISTFVSDGESSFIQFTAPISHGSSGGALFDAAGQVIGIPCAFLDAGQNLNFAVDIDDVIVLYANRLEYPTSFTQYFTSLEEDKTTSASPNPTLESYQKSSSHVSNLTARQIGPNSVELSWSEGTYGSFEYSVFCSMDADLDVFFIDSTQDTSYVFNDLVPGYDYTFYVYGDTKELMDNKTSIKIEEADPFTARNFKKKSLELYYSNHGENFWNTKRTKITKFTLNDLNKADVTRDYSLVLGFGVGAADQDSVWKATICITSPNDNILVYNTTCDIGKDAYSTFRLVLTINGIMRDCANLNEKGTYTIRLYFNGQPAAKMNFSVK